jgi:hypothetical protein
MRVDRIYRLYREEGLAVRAYADYLTATGDRAPLQERSARYPVAHTQPKGVSQRIRRLRGEWL